MKVGKKQVKGTLYSDDFIKIYDSGEIGSAVTSLTISGLDGDVDEEYKLLFRQISAAAGSSPFLSFNSDVTSGHYGLQSMVGRNTPTATRDGTPAGIQLNNQIATASGNTLFCIADIYAKTGYVRTAQTWTMENTSGTSVDTIQTQAWAWTDTSNNITSITIASNAAGGLGVGTRIELYAKRSHT